MRSSNNLVAASRSVGEVEELDGVPGPDPAFVVLGDVGIDLVDNRPGIGPFVLDMREVGREHDAVDADMLPLLDRDALVLHAEIDVVAHVMARQLLQGLEAEIFLRPAEMALIPEIGMFEPEWDPAEACLGEKDLQFWEALKNAGKNELCDADRRPETE